MKLSEIDPEQIKIGDLLETNIYGSITVAKIVYVYKDKWWTPPGHKEWYKYSLAIELRYSLMILKQENFKNYTYIGQKQNDDMQSF